MAVQPQTPYKEYIANGVTTVFALGFDCKDKASLVVMIDGVIPDSGSWSLSSNTVTFAVAPPNQKKVSFKRNTPFKRTINYQSYDNSFRPDAVNNDFDLIWYALQENQFALDISVKVDRKIQTSGNLQGGGALDQDLTLSLKDQLVTPDFSYGSSVKIPVITLNQDGTVKSILESDLTGVTPALTYIPWSNVLNKPTTLAGYGVLNAYTKLEVDSAFIKDSKRGVASGVAPLNANTKVDEVYLSAATESTKGAAMIASSISVNAATDDARFVTPLKLLGGVKNHLNVSGDAPMYACRAWVNFNGVGVVTINAGGNVSSITDNGIGDYTINFLTAMPHTNYSIAAIPSEYSDGSPLAVSLRMSGTSPLLKTASSVRASTRSGYNSQLLDVNAISIQVFC